MSKIITHPPDPTCSLLFPGDEIEEVQPLAPDPPLPPLPCARDTRGRFAKGSSGNPRGRPRGIPNPKRRRPNLAARPLNMRVLADLIGRQPHLLRPIAAQLLPSAFPVSDPAELLGIYLSPLRTAEDCRQVLTTLLAAVVRGKIAPADGARIARQVHARLRAARRLARSERRLELRPSAK